MKKSSITTAVATAAIALAGVGAIAAASSVGTTPEPELISRFQSGRVTTTTDHRPSVPSTSVDDQGNDTPTTSSVSTPTTFDDHGNNTPTTQGVTPTTVDDHGGNRGSGSGSSGSDDGPSHS
jgi:hypothetical protein